MGALISIHAVNMAPRLYNGVVLSGPPLAVDLPPGARQILPVLGSLLPKMPAPPLELSTLTRDLSAVDRYHNDPLNNQGHNTIRLISELIKAMDKVETFRENFPIPYLLLAGSKDKMCPIRGSEEFHKHTKQKDKTFVTYDGAFHELYNEPDSDEKAIPETIQWLEARL